MVQKNLFTEPEIDSHRKQTYDYQRGNRGAGRRRDKLGVSD